MNVHLYLLFRGIINFIYNNVCCNYIMTKTFNSLKYINFIQQRNSCKRNIVLCEP